MVNDIEKILETIDLETTPPLEEPMRQYYFLKKYFVASLLFPFH